MRILLKAVRITDVQSSHNNTSKDILISNGTIEAIGTRLNVDDALIVAQPQLHVSQGWVDFKSSLMDPGFDESGGIAKGLDQAALGGFTHIGVLPNDLPASDSRTSIEYKLRMAENHAVCLHPIGAITQKMAGNSLAEMYDMFQAGARFFSDDLSEQRTETTVRALQYTKDFGAKLILSSTFHCGEQPSLVHEGTASLRTGLKGDSDMEERLNIQRAIELAKYVECPIHISGISTQSVLFMIEKAKSEGLQITCDTNLMNLCFNEEATLDFDTRFKTKPVLRTEIDRIALIAALKSGLIDAVVSDHRPSITDTKKTMFDEAAIGSPQLSTVFAALAHYSGLKTDEIVQILSINNRKTFCIDACPIESGNPVDMTLYIPGSHFSWGNTNPQHRELSPFNEVPMLGQVHGILRGNKAILNHVD